MLDRLSIGSLSYNDLRLWAAVLASFGMTVACMHLLVIEYRVYTLRRHQFLSKLDTQQYSVLVDHIPRHLRSHTALRHYFETIFPGQVLAVYLVVECRALEHLTAERVAVRNALEHAMVKARETRQRPYHWKRLSSAWFDYGHVDSITDYTARLELLNDEVVKAITSIEAQQRIGMSTKTKTVRQMSICDRDAKTETSPPPLDHGEATPLLHTHNVYQACASPDVSSFLPSTTAAAATVLRPSAFIAFSSLQATNTIQQLIQTANPTEMNIQEAPPAHDIIWPYVGFMNHAQSKMAFVLTTTVSALVILFWTVPTTLIVALASVSMPERYRYIYRKILSGLSTRGSPMRVCLATLGDET
jgi:hypothetical protein